MCIHICEYALLVKCICIVYTWTCMISALIAQKQPFNLMFSLWLNNRMKCRFYGWIVHLWYSFGSESLLMGKEENDDLINELRGWMNVIDISIKGHFSPWFEKHLIKVSFFLVYSFSSELFRSENEMTSELHVGYLCDDEPIWRCGGQKL